MSELFVISRRDFLTALGLGASGLALGLRPALAAPSHGAGAGTWPALPDGVRPNAFVHLAPDGVLTIVCARSEMGQGVRSSLPVLIADEMGADPAHVRIVQGDGDAAYGNQDTDDSSSVRGEFDKLRLAGAGARTMLIGAAAETWKVTPQSCEAHGHAVHHPASGRSLGFGELAVRAAQQPVPNGKALTLRPRSELPNLGKMLPLVDAPDIVTGRTQYGADVQLPGMLIAVIVRPPVVGGRVVKYDAQRTLAIRGVRKVVVLPVPKPPFAFQPLGGVAVVADDTWSAMRGAHALAIEWDAGPNAAYDSERYRATLAQAVATPGEVVRKVGDVDAALASAARKLEAVYHTPHLAHAPMEPPVALARVVGDRVEVWTSTQNPQASREQVAKSLGISEKHVTVHVTFLGGGFGRKSKPDYVAEAALLAREVGVPVRVQWRREDDVQHDYYHSTAAQRLVAGLDASGKVVAWHHRVAFPPIGSTFSDTSTPSAGELEQGVTDLPLAVPNLRVERCDAKAMTRIGWMRSVANVYHAFAVQSFIDEIAAARGTDPRDLRLELLGPDRMVTPAELGVPKLDNYGQSLDEHPIDTRRMREVIERVTKAARWDVRKQEGRALGLAAHRSFLTYVAVVASVVHDARGRVRVDEAWICTDAGTILNEERVRSQMEGAVMFGMSGALYSAIHMKNGATVEDNFHTYRVTRMAEAPRAIHVDLVRSDRPPAGVGEPGVPPVAPAIANAVFALTGKRARELPLSRIVPT
jgi:isoquinoline 1-oxidoreductase beta subunit